MCIPHTYAGIPRGHTMRMRKTKKHRERVPREQFEHGDPNFVDERKKSTPAAKS
jgi:hypothetical protein